MLVRASGIQRCTAIVTAFAITFLCLASFAAAAPGDYSWQRAVTNSADTTAKWMSIASNSDGTKLAATVGQGGYIYTSNDSGATWTERTTAGKRNWKAIASSSDGTKLVATVTLGYIYTSNDSGATWVEQTNPGSRMWYEVTSSSDGTRLAAMVQGGYIYTSTDSGVTWTEHTDMRGNWLSITSNSDGTKLAVVAYSGYIYTSTDSGVTWTEQTAAGANNWCGIASSRDGTKLAVVTNGGYIYTSNDSGVTWTEQTAAGTRSWRRIASSSDGTKLVATVSGGYIYTSADSGATWTEQTGAGIRSWGAIASNSDGTKLAAPVYGDYIYLAAMEGPATISIPMPNLATSAQVATEAAIAQATLSVSSMTCYNFNQSSMKTLAATGVAAPANVTILGGVAFDLQCTRPGGSADLSLALGVHYQDLSQLHVYKTIGVGNTTPADVTSKFRLQNETTNGTTKTVIHYTVIDGADFDEDGIINGTITDPLYVGIATSNSLTTSSTLANTGADIWVVRVASCALLFVGVAVTARLRTDLAKKI